MLLIDIYSRELIEAVTADRMLPMIQETTIICVYIASVMRGSISKLLKRKSKGKILKKTIF